MPNGNDNHNKFKYNFGALLSAKCILLLFYYYAAKHIALLDKIASRVSIVCFRPSVDHIVRWTVVDQTWWTGWQAMKVAYRIYLLFGCAETFHWVTCNMQSLVFGKLRNSRDQGFVTGEIIVDPAPAQYSEGSSQCATRLVHQPACIPAEQIENWKYSIEPFVYYYLQQYLMVMHAFDRLLITLYSSLATLVHHCAIQNANVLLYALVEMLACLLYSNATESPTLASPTLFLRMKQLCEGERHMDTEILLSSILIFWVFQSCPQVSSRHPDFSFFLFFFLSLGCLACWGWSRDS